MAKKDDSVLDPAAKAEEEFATARCARTHSTISRPAKLKEHLKIFIQGREGPRRPADHGLFIRSRLAKPRSPILSREMGFNLRCPPPDPGLVGDLSALLTDTRRRRVLPLRDLRLIPREEALYP